MPKLHINKRLWSCKINLYYIKCKYLALNANYHVLSLKVLLISVLIRLKIVQTFIFFCKLHKIAINNVYKICLAKLDLAGHTLNLAGKCLVTGYYHKPCYLYSHLLLVWFWVIFHFCQAVPALISPRISHGTSLASMRVLIYTANNKRAARKMDSWLHSGAATSRLFICV